MKEARSQELVLAWIALYRAGAGATAREQGFWAYEALDEACRRDPEHAWQVILQIHARRPEEIVLANLAAGPVEDLLVHHGHTVLPWIERYCAEQPDFVQVLEMVWRNDIAEEVWHRLQRLPGSRRR